MSVVKMSKPKLSYGIFRRYLMCTYGNPHCLMPRGSSICPPNTNLSISRSGIWYIYICFKFSVSQAIVSVIIQTWILYSLIVHSPGISGKAQLSTVLGGMVITFSAAQLPFWVQNKTWIPLNILSCETIYLKITLHQFTFMYILSLLNQCRLRLIQHLWHGITKVPWI